MIISGRTSRKLWSGCVSELPGHCGLFRAGHVTTFTSALRLPSFSECFLGPRMARAPALSWHCVSCCRLSPKFYGQVIRCARRVSNSRHEHPQSLTHCPSACARPKADSPHCTCLALPSTPHGKGYDYRTGQLSWLNTLLPSRESATQKACCCLKSFLD